LVPPCIRAFPIASSTQPPQPPPLRDSTDTLLQASSGAFGICTSCSEDLPGVVLRKIWRSDQTTLVDNCEGQYLTSLYIVLGFDDAKRLISLRLIVAGRAGGAAGTELVENGGLVEK
jgi:hypothetical protein